MNLFDIIILHQDFSFQSKKVLNSLNTLSFVNYACYWNFTGFVCVHSGVKLFEKVINNTINIIKLHT